MMNSSHEAEYISLNSESDGGEEVEAEDRNNINLTTAKSPSTLGLGSLLRAKASSTTTVSSVLSILSGGGKSNRSNGSKNSTSSKSSRRVKHSSKRMAKVRPGHTGLLDSKAAAEGTHDADNDNAKHYDNYDNDVKHRHDANHPNYDIQNSNHDYCNEKMTIRSSWVWDVKMPPTKKPFIGMGMGMGMGMGLTRKKQSSTSSSSRSKFSISMALARRRPRRITVQIWSPSSNDTANDEGIGLGLDFGYSHHLDRDNDQSSPVVQTDKRLPHHAHDASGTDQHRDFDQQTANSDNDSNEEVVAGKALSREQHMNTHSNTQLHEIFPHTPFSLQLQQQEQLTHGEVVIIQISRPAKSKKDKDRARAYMDDLNGSSDSDDEIDDQDDLPSVSTLGLRGADEPENELYIETKRCNLKDVSISSHSRNICELKVLTSNSKDTKSLSLSKDPNILQTLPTPQSSSQRSLFANDSTSTSGLAFPTNITDSSQLFNNFSSTSNSTSDTAFKTLLMEIVFQTDSEASNFVSLIKKLKDLEKERTERDTYKTSFGDSLPSSLDGGGSLNLSMSNHNEIKVLIEIVSAVGKIRSSTFSYQSSLTDGPASTSIKYNTNSDVRVMCYCLIRVGNREVHRTGLVEDIVNPVWTAKSKSLFLFTIFPMDTFAMSHDVYFELREVSLWSTEDGNEKKEDRSLGFVSLKQTQILKGFGDRKEFVVDGAISDGQFCPDKYVGKLALRYRRAFDEDINFMKYLSMINSKEEEEDVQSSGSTINPYYNKASYIAPRVSKSQDSLKQYRIGEKGITEYLVQPTADTKRLQSTTWMTEGALEEESRKHSTNWIETGSGTVGKLYVEILGCDRLPKIKDNDTSVKNGNAFVCVVFESSVVNTDVITDKSSPRWMPWTQRAFIFNIKHTSSQLFLGVHYFNPNSKKDHGNAGRISINPSKFYPDTDYVLEYKIIASPVSIRDSLSSGTVTVRIRLELIKHRMAFLSSLRSCPTHTVQLGDLRDYNAAIYTCGKQNSTELNVDELALYIEDISLCEVALRHMKEGFLHLLFWKGQVKIQVCIPFKKKIHFFLPLHSAVAFGLGILLVENPNAIPSFLVGLVAWLLLAIAEYRTHQPSVWNHGGSYVNMMRSFIFNSSVTQSVLPYENEDDDMNHKLTNVIFQDNSAIFSSKKDKVENEGPNCDDDSWAQSEVSSMVTPIFDKQGILSKSHEKKLFELQTKLQKISNWIVATRNVFLWEECYHAFWITNASLFFATFFLFVNWNMVLYYCFKFLVWTFLGPWMWLVGKVYDSFSSKNKQDDQLDRENNMKNYDMKLLMFGDHTVKVPSLSIHKMIHSPLPSSHALPHKKAQGTTFQRSSYLRLSEQALTGKMIPFRTVKVDDECYLNETRPLIESSSVSAENKSYSYT